MKSYNVNGGEATEANLTSQIIATVNEFRCQTPSYVNNTDLAQPAPIDALPGAAKVICGFQRLVPTIGVGSENAIPLFKAVPAGVALNERGQDLVIYAHYETGEPIFPQWETSPNGWYLVAFYNQAVSSNTPTYGFSTMAADGVQANYGSRWKIEREEVAASNSKYSEYAPVYKYYCYHTAGAGLVLGVTGQYGNTAQNMPASLDLSKSEAMVATIGIRTQPSKKDTLQFLFGSDYIGHFDAHIGYTEQADQ